MARTRRDQPGLHPVFTRRDQTNRDARHSTKLHACQSVMLAKFASHNDLQFALSIFEIALNDTHLCIYKENTIK